MIRKLKQGVRKVIGLKNDTDYYSQAGEDAILLKTFMYLLPIQKGVYVDIGAFHPYTHSNTYLLYRWGWRGINIDPRPGSKMLFDRYRPDDINIEAGIGGTDSSMTYYMLEDLPVMNTFSRENLVKLDVLDKVTRTLEVPVLTYRSLLKQNPSIHAIDYLNIDAEGFEMEILNGLKGETILPKVITIEQNDVLTLKEVEESDPAKFLSSLGYTAYAKNILLKNVCTVFYIRNEYLQPNTELK